jgi:2-oxoglutarate ferredoxin oxidoreductase subunit alpha
MVFPLLLVFFFKMKKQQLILLSYGITHRSTEKAFKILTNRYYRVSDLKINTLWPFPYEFFDELPKTVKKILVVEHNWGKYYREVERYALRRGIEVHSLTRYDGTIINSEEIVEKAEELLK